MDLLHRKSNSVNYPVNTPSQLRAVLRALRKARGLTQAELGRQVGRSQKRIAQIEAAPERTSFDQISQLVAMLGGRVVIHDADDGDNKPPPTPDW